MLRHPCMLAALVVLAHGHLAVAQAPAEQPQNDVGPSSTDADPTAIDLRSPAERAREHFRSGMRAFDERRFRDAIVEFRRASELVPSADLTFNIARAEEELGELDAAIESYRRYLRDRVDPPDREAVEEHIRQLEERAEAMRLSAREAPSTGTLRVDVDRPGAVVRIDGREVGTSPIALPLTYGTGEHQVEVSLDGYVPFRARVRVLPATTVVADARLVRATNYHAVLGRRRFTWVMAGLSAVAAGAAIGLGAHAMSVRDPLDQSEARRFARYSDYALGGAAVFGVGTVTLYFGEGRSVRTERIE